MDDGGKAATKIVDDNFEVASIMGYDPGIYAGVPDGVTEGEDELDVGVVFGHAKDEATGNDFEGDGVAGVWGWEKGGSWKFAGCVGFGQMVKFGGDFGFGKWLMGIWGTKRGKGIFEYRRYVGNWFMD